MIDYNFSSIYPTKNQRIEEQKKKLIMNPKNIQEAQKNQSLQKRIKEIKAVF